MTHQYNLPRTFISPYLHIDYLYVPHILFPLLEYMTIKPISIYSIFVI